MTSLFYSYGNQGSASWSVLPQITPQLSGRAGTGIQVSLTSKFPLLLQPTEALIPASIQAFCPINRYVGQALVSKIQGSLGRRMTAHPSVHQEWGRETRDWHAAYPWLFLGAKQTQKESLLKEHSVFPSLLTSPGPVPMIIGKQRVWFFWDQNQSYEECSDNKCCWLTVDGQCSRVSFSWAGCCAKNCTKQLLNSLLPFQIEFTTPSCCGPQSGSRARWYLRFPPAPSFSDSIKKRKQIWKDFFPQTLSRLLFTHRNTDSNREITGQKISCNAVLILFDPIIPLVRIYLKEIIQKDRAMYTKIFALA